MKLVPERAIVNLDFNYQTSISRGINMNTLDSVRILVKYMINYKTSNIYNDKVMLDLKSILNKKINILDFFRESVFEKRSVQRDVQAGNIEQLVYHPDVEQFSHMPMQYLNIDKIDVKKVSEMAADAII